MLCVLRHLRFRMYRSLSPYSLNRFHMVPLCAIYKPNPNQFSCGPTKLTGSAVNVNIIIDKNLVRHTVGSLRKFICQVYVACNFRFWRICRAALAFRRLSRCWQGGGHIFLKRSTLPNATLKSPNFKANKVQVCSSESEKASVLGTFRL